MNRIPNLATRPLRNERLPAVLMIALLVVLTGVTVRHAFALRELLPGRTAAVEGEVRRLEEELASLRTETRSLPRVQPDKAKMGEWRTISELVDRRAMSWVRLLERLEEVLPADVRLGSIAPVIRDGRIGFEMVAFSRNQSDAIGLLKVLQDAEDFYDVVPASIGSNDRGEAELRFSMKYRQVATPPTTVPAAPAGEQAAPPPAEGEGAVEGTAEGGAEGVAGGQGPAKGGAMNPVER